MKRTVWLSIMFFLSIIAYGQEFTADGLNYSIISLTDKTVSITGAEPSLAGDLVIPNTVHSNGFGQDVESASWSLGGSWNAKIDENAPAYQSKVYECKMYNKEYTSSVAQCTFKTSGSITFAVKLSGMSDYYSNYAEIAAMDENVLSSSSQKKLLNSSDNGSINYFTFTPEDNNEHFVQFRAYVSTYGNINMTIYVVDIPKCDYKVTKVNSSVFSGFKDITSISIPSNVTSIGEDAFKNCNAVTSIYYNAKSCSCGSNVFYNAGSSTAGIALTIGNEVENIPASLFYSSYSPKIKTVDFEEDSSCRAIGNSTFRDCSELTSILIPSSVSSIGTYAFYGCSKLTSVNIPNAITKIQNNSFTNCSNLTSITIPSTVSTIDGGAFSGCSNLKDIHSQNIAPPTLGSGVFNNVDKNQTLLYVPKGSKEFYAKATQWKDFVCIIENTENEETDDLKSKIESLESENASLKTQITTLKTENAALKTELDDLSTKAVYDLNGDKKITIADVTTLIDAIVNQ